MNLFPALRTFLVRTAQKAGKLPFMTFAYNGTAKPVLPPTLRDATVTRTGDTATMVNEQGLIVSVPANVPRWDWAEGLGCPSLLVEPQRTNLKTFSTDVDNVSFQKAALVKNGDATSVIEGATARRYDPSGTDVFSSLNMTSLGGGVTGEITFYYIVESAGWQWVELLTMQDPDASRVWFDLENGVKGIDADGVGSISEIGSGSGVYLISYTTSGRPSGSTLTCFFSFRSADGSSAAINGDGTGVIFHAAQYEAGLYPTSLIITEASTETRNADVISLTNAADLIGQSEGGLFYHVTRVNNGGAYNGIELQSAGAADRLIIQFNSGQIRLVLIDAGGTAVSSFTTVASNDIKVAFVYTAANTKLFINGSLMATIRAVNLSAPLSQVVFGTATGATELSYKSAAISKTALTDSEYEAITS